MKDWNNVRHAAAGQAGIQPFDGSHVFEKFQPAQVGLDAEILRKVTQHGTQNVGALEDIHAIPQNRALGGPGNGGQHAHQSGFAGPIGTEQADHPGTHFEVKITQAPEITAVLLRKMGDAKIHVCGLFWV